MPDWTERQVNMSNIRSLKIRGLPAFRDNYIWMLDSDREAIVVDPGDAAPVLEALAAEGLRLAGIWITHHHADHVGGVGELCARYPGIPVSGPAAESITGVTRPLMGGETFEAFGITWTVLSVPGHTLGHIAYFGNRGGHPVLFCGDVLFGLGCGRLFEGTAVQMATSLDAIATLPDATEIYCAHEYTALNAPFAQDMDPDNAALDLRVAETSRRRKAGLATVPFTLAEEKATNPFLRCREPALAASAREIDPGLDPHNPVAVFAALRLGRDRC
jgi:hydroxyacylglutathione hydrolase